MWCDCYICFSLDTPPSRSHCLSFTTKTHQQISNRAEKIKSNMCLPSWEIRAMCARCLHASLNRHNMLMCSLVDFRLRFSCSVNYYALTRVRDAKLRHTSLPLLAVPHVWLFSVCDCYWVVILFRLNPSDRWIKWQPLTPAAVIATNQASTNGKQNTPYLSFHCFDLLRYCHTNGWRSLVSVAFIRQELMRIHTHTNKITTCTNNNQLIECDPVSRSCHRLNWWLFTQQCVFNLEFLPNLGISITFHVL